MKSLLFKPPHMLSVSLEEGLVFLALSAYSSAHVEKAGGLPKGKPRFSECHFIDTAKETAVKRESKKEWTQEENLMMRKNQLALIQKQGQLQL